MYASELVVRRDSEIRCADDLRSCSVAYNDQVSLSGLHVLRYWMAATSRHHFFSGGGVRSGSHLRSMQLVASGSVDAAAIDCLVWKRAQQSHPELVSQLRVLDDVPLGPSPIQPVVAARRLPDAVKANLTTALLQLHASGQPVGLSHVSRFVAVSDADYVATSHIVHLSQTVDLRPRSCTAQFSSSSTAAAKSRSWPHKCKATALLLTLAITLPMAVVLCGGSLKLQLLPQ